MSKTEKWFPVRGYTGLYEITKSGRVRSCDRKTKVIRASGTAFNMYFKGRELTPVIVGNSFGSVNLCKNGIAVNVSISKLLKQFNGK